MSTIARPDRLMTAEEFAAESDDRRTELVRGKVVIMSPASIYHGRVQARIARLMGNFVHERDLGDVFGEAGMITNRDPDSVRGPDVMFYSWERLPQGKAAASFTEVPAEIVFEVLSPSQSIKTLTEKAEEYLAAGVLWIGIVDPNRREIRVHELDKPVSILTDQDALHLPAPLEEWNPRVGDLFP